MLAVVACTALFQAPYAHRKYIRSVAEESAVQIFGQNGRGSGAHVRLKSGKVVILTNKHICEMKGPLTVKAVGAKLAVERKIIKISKEHDLCVMEALSDRTGIRIGTAPTLGDELYTLGHPRGDALNVAKGEYFDDIQITMGEEPNLDGSCKEGISTRQESWLGSYDICLYKRNTIQISTPTYPGNSGSTVVNKYGQLVAVIFAGNPSIENNGYAVPLSYVKDFLNSL